jgi:two-component system sensor histidine kinase HydH
LKGALQLLLQERERLPEDRREYLELMLLQSQRMEEVIETYRRLSCVEPVLRPTSVNELVGRALTQAALAGDQGAEGIRIRQELREGLPTLQADQELLASAVENVVRNAREAMPHGGALEVLTSFEPRERGRGDVVIRIADDGVGMDARQLERAFDDFFTTKAQGSGLGLSFARRVVEAHGGEVRLSSALGRGTVVEFVLPAGEAAGRGGAA